jgi:hypothetical protein
MARSRRTPDERAPARRRIAQMVYIDPPYGIRYGSNFQPFVNNRDTERMEKYRGTVSLPFETGAHRRVAVKIVDDRGIESLKVMPIS